MDAQAGMLAKLFERSMGLGPDWEVSDVWLEQKEKGPDELHIRVAHVKEQAVECPECGRRCGIYDARERTWRHLDIWQCETIVHCAVPRADCPEHGVHAVRMPWEVRPNSRFTALSGAQALAMAISGLTATQMASQMRMSDGTVWRMLGRAVAEAGDAAGYSDVARVGTGGTACRRGQSCITTMAGLDGRKAVAVTGGRGKGATGRLCGGLEAHGGDRTAIEEVTRDMSEAYAPGIAAEMPQALQAIDRFHAMQLASKAADRVRCREAKSSEEKGRLLKGTKCCWLKRPENLTERQAAKKGSLMKERLLTARACAMAGAIRGICECPDRESAPAELDRATTWIMHSSVPEMKAVAQTLRKEREGILNWFSRNATNAILEGPSSIIQSAKRAARGFRNIGYLGTMIFLGLGRLDFSAQLAVSSATH